MPHLVIKTDGGLLVVEPSELARLEEFEIDYREEECLTEDALIAKCQAAAGLLVVREPVTAEVINSLTACRVITRFGVGLDNVDVDAASANGIRVTNVPDANVQEVATHALAMILSLNRKLFEFDRHVRSNNWGFQLGGREIRRADSLVLGVVGFGRIGSRVASMAKALGFTVIAHDAFCSNVLLRGQGVEPVCLADLLARADVISLHIPLSRETHHMINATTLAEMKRSAILVNVSRGALVDEVALAEALRSGRLGAAGLDTFAQEPLPANSPLRSCESVVFSPHAAHYSLEARRETVRKGFEDVVRVLRGEEPMYPVN